jgi:hypothetical protein
MDLDETTGAVYVATGGDLAGVDGDDHLFRSQTFGADWTELTYPPVRHAPSVAAQGETILTGDMEYSRIARSVDGGISWTLHNVDAYGGASTIWDIKFDPLDENQVFLASGLGGVIRSRDGGRTFESLQRAAYQPSGAIGFFPSSDAGGDLSTRPLMAGIGGLRRVVPGPNPAHPAEIAGRVEAGNTVRCETGEWSRTFTVSYAWFNGDGERYFGATGPTFRVPKPGNGGWDVSCAAIGKGPGGSYRTRSPVQPIRRG